MSIDASNPKSLDAIFLSLIPAFPTDVPLLVTYLKGLTCSCHCAVAALSTALSTAALDKHPQSKERGITLDLGFSSFNVSALILPSMHLYL